MVNTAPDLGPEADRRDEPPAHAPEGDADVPPRPADLPVEPAVAFGVEGYDPDDPWNAALYVETDSVVGVLPLTPKTLGGLLGTLTEVNAAQRGALGLVDQPAEADRKDERQPALRRVSHAARLMTGSQPVYRLWNASTRGRVTIIGFAVLFVLIGVILSML